MVKPNAKTYLAGLKKELIKKGYSPSYYIFSTKRFGLQNDFLAKFGGAAKKSQNLTGNAIDIIVLDINKDGERDEKDVNIVYGILDKKIIGNKGGIGTYKNQKGFFNRQMVHLDARGKRARWHR